MGKILHKGANPPDRTGWGTKEMLPSCDIWTYGLKPESLCFYNPTLKRGVTMQNCIGFSHSKNDFRKERVIL